MRKDLPKQSNVVWLEPSTDSGLNTLLMVNTAIVSLMLLSHSLMLHWCWNVNLRMWSRPRRRLSSSIGRSSKSATVSKLEPSSSVDRFPRFLSAQLSLQPSSPPSS